MSDITSKISELNPLSGGNMAGEIPISLTLSSGSLATNKLALSQVRDLFDFNNAFDDVASGIAATVENQMFYVYVDATKLSVNEYIRNSVGASAVVTASSSKKVIYIPALLKHVKVQVESFAALRGFRPWWDGQVIYLKGYYEDDSNGSGDFVGRLGARDDDGGANAAGPDFYWERIIHNGIVTPEMFDAIGDAVFSPTSNTAAGTDNTLPLQQMINFAATAGYEMNLSPGKKYLTGSLFAYKDDILNPEYPARSGRFRITGSAIGHSTGDVENVGAALIQIPGQTSPLLSVIGLFSVSNPTGMGGYFQLERINLIGSKVSSDVLMIQGSQGFIELNAITVKITNPSGNGITQNTVWDIIQRNVLIRGGATGLGTWTGIGLNICTDGSAGQTNMSIYDNVECYRCGYGIYIGRGSAAQGTFGPISFRGGQTSNSDQHGMVLGGGVIAFTSISQQHEGARLNAIRIDRTLPDGTLSTDIPRTIKLQGTYITGSGLIEDDTVNSYAIYIANGDGVEIDTVTFNNAGNSIAFSASDVDNLFIRRPTWRTVRTYGSSSGIGIKAFGTQDATKRIYLEHPTFNQNPSTQIDSLAKQIFARGYVKGRLSFSGNQTAPSISLGGTTGSEPVSQINFNNANPTTLTSITGGNQFQEILITFSNTLTTIPNNKTGFILNGSDFTPTGPNSILKLYFNGTVWVEISRSINS